MLAALGLVLIGLAAIDTAPSTPLTRNVAVKQLLFLFIGLGVMAVVAMPHHRTIGQIAYPLAIVSAVLLLVLMIPGMPQLIVPVKNGARRCHDNTIRPGGIREMRHLPSPGIE